MYGNPPAAPEKQPPTGKAAPPRVADTSEEGKSTASVPDLHELSLQQLVTQFFPTVQHHHYTYDTVVVGCGIAGCATGTTAAGAAGAAGGAEGGGALAAAAAAGAAAACLTSCACVKIIKKKAAR